MQLEGGCQLNERGVFHAFLGGQGRARAPLVDESFRQWLREVYDFLMADDHTRMVGERTLVRTFTPTRRKLPKVTVPIVGGFRVTLIHIKDKAPSFCKFVVEVPFETLASGNDYLEEPWRPQGRPEAYDDDEGGDECMP